jgi:hypothetical protein
VETNRIAALSAFAGLPAAELDELAGAMDVVEVDAGTNVVTVDDYGTAIYFEEGAADVVIDRATPRSASDLEMRSARSRCC